MGCVAGSLQQEILPKKKPVGDVFEFPFKVFFQDKKPVDVWAVGAKPEKGRNPLLG